MAPEISFSTLGAIMRVDATLAHGMTPSVIRIDFPEQAAPIDRGGDLRFKFNGNQVVFKDCLIDQSSLQAGSAGKIKTLAVFDRRWRWEFQNVSFSFNEQNDANEIRTSPGLLDLINEGYNATEIQVIKSFFNTKKSASGIADYLLFAMGETRRGINQLPRDVYPEFGFDNIRPAMALSMLCSMYSCSFGLQLDNRIGVWTLGRGKALPRNLSILSESKTVDLNSRPEAVSVVTAPVLYQYDFRLEAVGEETDGNFVPIDELSYKPAAGWGGYANTMRGFLDLSAADAISKKNKKLATRSVFKAFRPVYRAPQAVAGTPVLIDGNRVVVYEQISPFKTTLTTTVFEQGAKRAQPALVYGQHKEYGIGALNVSDADFEVPSGEDAGESESAVSYNWQLDTENGLVWFSVPMVRIDGDDVNPADLFLRVAFHMKSEVDRVRFRREFFRSIDPPFNAGLVLRQVVAALQPTVRYDFEIAPGPTKGAAAPIRINGPPVDNTMALAAQPDSQAIRAKAQPYLKALKRKVEDESGPEDITYEGVVASVELDGAIRSITWVLSTQGVVTRMQRNQDLGSSTTLGASELRHIERSRQVLIQNDRVPNKRLRETEATP